MVGIKNKLIEFLNAWWLVLMQNLPSILRAQVSLRGYPESTSGRYIWRFTMHFCYS